MKQTVKYTFAKTKPFWFYRLHTNPLKVNPLQPMTLPELIYPLYNIIHYIQALLTILPGYSNETITRILCIKKHCL